MYFLYDVFRCLNNCFKYLRIFYVILHLPYLISVVFEIFEKISSIFCLKSFIYLFNFHIGLEVGLDYDSINTIIRF